MNEFWQNLLDNGTKIAGGLLNNGNNTPPAPVAQPKTSNTPWIVGGVIALVVIVAVVFIGKGKRSA